MKLEVNSKFFCGSNKKYKKCCMNKNINDTYKAFDKVYFKKNVYDYIIQYIDENEFILRFKDDSILEVEFIKNKLFVIISFDDIDMNSNITDKVIHTICKELDMLGVYKRPIHCTDIKRHKACIKDGNEWKREQEPLMKQGVMKVSGKYQQTLNEWAKKHPGWDDDQELSEKMMDMMNIYIRPPSEDKCINTILKHTVIDHENGTK